MPFGQIEQYNQAQNRPPMSKESQNSTVPRLPRLAEYVGRNISSWCVWLLFVYWICSM